MLPGVPVHAEVPHEFLVGVAVGQPDGPGEVAEERHVGHDGDESFRQCAGSEGDTTTLAAAGDGKAIRVDLGKHADGVNRTDGIRENPAVVVVGRVIYSAGHVSVGCGAGAVRVGSLAASAPRRALAARVHDQVRVAGRRPRKPLGGEAPSAAVSDVLDHRGKRGGCAGGYQQPGLDRVAAETRERHIEHVDRPQRRVDRSQSRLPARDAGFLERDGPEGVEVCGFVDLRDIGLELSGGEVEVGHAASFPGGAQAPLACYGSCPVDD